MRLVLAITILLFIVVAPACFAQPQTGQPATNSAAGAPAASNTSNTSAQTPKPFSQSLKEDYPWCVVGILLSIVLPMLKRLMPKVEPGVSEARASYFSVVWPKIKPYVVIGIFSILTGIIVIAFAGDSLADERAAILAGYAWDSTLQKLAGPKG